MPLELGERVFGWLVGWGSDASYVTARWLFLRALGLVFFVAFVSFWVQAPGLVGRGGILPLRHFLGSLRGHRWATRWRAAPTIFWLAPTDAMLHAVCAAGTAVSVLLILDVAPALCLIALWALYLSVVAVGQDFMSFQWDVLLVETALFGALLAPWRILPGDTDPAVSTAGLVLLWWVLFRLTFQSGVVKLTSGDHTWRDLTALHYHYCTQPLPTWVSWYAHHAPSWFKKFSVAVALALETLFPLFIFGPPEVRLAGAAGIVLLQVLIFVTGNYNFFNWLAVALALLLVHDTVLEVVIPPAVVSWVPPAEGDVTVWHGTAVLAAAPFALVIGGVRVWQSFFPHRWPARWLHALVRIADPFRTINGYGLFRVMTTTRPEIGVEGSADGSTWETYEFKWKPGDPMRRPRFVAPHQPRLDWQMWFAALSGFGRAAWFHAFLARLLEGSSVVLGLLRRNPFPDRPPRYVRARLYDYWFTSPSERRVTGAWWRRTELGAYSPVVTLDR